MNVLLTACGRRSYLVEYFRQALDGAGLVICANSQPDSSAMRAADLAIPVPRSDHPDYVPAILEICRQYEVAMLTSLHDLDLLILSQHLEDIRNCGTVPVLPDFETARLCLDKFAMTDRLSALGLPTPWTCLDPDEAVRSIESGMVEWPLMVKDRLGFGSVGLFECRSVDDLRYACSRLNLSNHLASKFLTPEVSPERNAMIQQKLTGSEFCLGLISDLDGKLVAHTRTEILAMRAGESDVAISRDASADKALAALLGNLLKVPGYCGVDWIRDGNQCHVIDVNPRFTGDYPFSHLAGVDVPAALLAWARGEQPASEWLRARPDVEAHKALVPQLSKPVRVELAERGVWQNHAV